MVFLLELNFPQCNPLRQFIFFNVKSQAGNWTDTLLQNITIAPDLYCNVKASHYQLFSGMNKSLVSPTATTLPIKLHAETDEEKKANRSPALTTEETVQSGSVGFPTHIPLPTSNSHFGFIFNSF